MSIKLINEKLNREIVVPQPEFEAALKSVGWTVEQVLRGEMPPNIKDLAELQRAIIVNDHYLWCQFFLKHPEDNRPWPERAPWEFFDYHIDFIRWNKSFVLLCGAETGKTFGISAKGIAIGCTRPGGSGMYGAPERDQLTPIYEMILDQLEGSPLLKGMLKEAKTQPHLDIKLTNGFKIIFRPSKHDGKTYRSKHIKDFCFKDEAAKDHPIMTWSEFYRSMKPGCVLGVSSVPDGRRDTEFYRLAEMARLIETGKDYAKSGGSMAEPDEMSIDEKLEDTKLRLFRWTKPMMPSPFWSAERKEEMITLYNGEDNPRYLHNVLAEHGDPEATEFPWNQFSLCLDILPEFKGLKVMIDEGKNNATLHLYSIEDKEIRTIQKKTISLDGFNIGSEIKTAFKFDPSIAAYFMGGDLGYTNDPTEFLVKAVIGKEHRTVARIQLRGVKYDIQADTWDALDDIYDRGKHEMVSGFDAGNAGTGFFHTLVRLYPDKKYPERCQPIQFGSKGDVLGPDKQPVLDSHTQKPLRRRVKTLSTQMLITMMQAGDLTYPWDPDIRSQYPGHTSRSGQDGDTIYTDGNDHIIDADRAGTYAYVRPGMEPVNVEEACSTGQRLTTIGNESGAFLT